MAVTDNTILITGGAGGIGFALARQLLARRNKVIICGRNAEALTRAREEAPSLITRVHDVSVPEQRRALAAWLEAMHPDLSVLINNAGVQRFRDCKDPDWLDGAEEEIAINLTAPIQLTGALLPLLRRQKQAMIVNVSSGLAFSPMADCPIYCATKAALHSFTLSLRHQLRASAIKVVEIAPPRVDTDLGGGLNNASGDARGLSAEAFADAALAQLDTGEHEILVGRAREIRREGEAMFARMNSVQP